MTRTMFLAMGAALVVAAPAIAQDQIAQDQIAPDRAVDPATEAALNQSNVMTVRNIDRTELARGVAVYDASGKPVGTVARLDGNDVILEDGAREYRVPITEFFAYNQYGKDYFAVRATKTALQGRGAATAMADR